MPKSDEELITEVQAGDAAAFDELFARYEPVVRRRLRRIVQSAVAAEDLLQDVFLRVWTKSSTWTGSGPVGAWLQRIAFNAAMNHLRGSKRKWETPLRMPTTPADDDDEQSDGVYRELESSLPGPDTEAERSQVRGLVRRLINELPEAKREVMELVHGQELSIREVSETLGVPEGTVKSRLFYGKRAIEGRLKDFL